MTEDATEHDVTAGTASFSRDTDSSGTASDEAIERVRERRRSREQLLDRYESLREAARDPEPDDRTLDRPETCWNCGYGLRGLETRGVCPECTKTVYGSRDPHFRVGVRWKRMATIGLWSAAAALTMSVLTGPLSWLIGVPSVIFTGYLWLFADRGHLRYGAPRRQVVAFWLALASVLIGLIGLMLILGI